MVVSTNKIRTLFIIILLAAMENFFYLIDTDVFSISGSFSYDVIWLIVMVLFFAYFYLTRAMWQCGIKCHFSIEITLLSIMVIVAAFQCYFATDQPIIRGLLPQRNFLMILLCYFVIRRMLYLDLIDVDYLKNGIICIGVISVLLYLIQASLGDSLQFLFVKSNERYGSTRLYVDSVLCTVIAFWGIDGFFKTRKGRYLFLVLLSFAYEIFVSKGRLELVAFSAAILIGVILIRENSLLKMSAFIVSIIAVVIFFNSTYGQLLIQSFTGTDVSGAGNTMEIRQAGRVLYFSQLRESVSNFIFGCGYPSELWSPAASRAGIYSRIYLSDNGIFSFFYVYGLLGLMAAIILFGKMLIYGWRLLKRDNTFFYLLFTLFQIFLMYNIAFWWWKASWTFMTVIFIALMEYDLFDCNQLYDDRDEEVYYE